MPVIVTFDVPVTDKAYDREAHARSPRRPQQPGTWHWTQRQRGPLPAEDLLEGRHPGRRRRRHQRRRRRQRHLRPGEPRRRASASATPTSTRSTCSTHQMKVFSNGKLLRTLPITTGEQPEFTTRSGIKVIIEKFDSKRMNSETVGIPPAPRRLRHRQRPVGHAGDLLRRVRPRRAVVGRLPGPRQRLPRLHRHEHRERRLALPHDPARRRRRLHRHRPPAWSRPTATATGTSPGTTTSRAPR